MYHKILFPTDGSKNAEKAGRHALWIARASNADILILNIYELYSPRMAALPLNIVPASNESSYEPLMEEANNIVEEFKANLERIEHEDVYKEIKISTAVKEGKPYHEILKTIEEEGIDLVVMGASGRHGIDRITLGSVTEKVVRESKKPVMVIP